MTQQYNDPAGGTESDIGATQMETYKYDKMALIEAKREQYFMPLSSTKNLPKNMGKKIKKYHYLPLLDDRNINDQGLDASGATLVDGNLYGSSKDAGVIASKLPVLSENGGRVNRVGFTRQEIEGSIAKFGFFDEYTQESMDFDSDADLEMHIRREMVNGASELTEDALQVDLLNSAGVVKFAGDATNTGEVAAVVVTYADLLRLSIELDQNRTPKQTTVITGSRNIDTKTIRGGRVMYIGSELIPTMESITNSFGEQAFVSVEKYASAGTTLNGEIGTVGHFRIVVVPEMQSWAGAGSNTVDDQFYATGSKYDVFPMLVVGDGSFSTIGFQTDGKTVKFKVKHAKPGSTESYAIDPYGETGFMSIKWYYGFLLERPERLALVKTAAIL